MSVDYKTSTGKAEPEREPYGRCEVGSTVSLRTNRWWDKDGISATCLC